MLILQHIQSLTEDKLYSNFIGKIFAFLFKSDRPACIRYIREHGEQAFAEEMTKCKCQTMKRNFKYDQETVC